jgi:hypothetical protein
MGTERTRVGANGPGPSRYTFTNRTDSVLSPFFGEDDFGGRMVAAQTRVEILGIAIRLTNQAVILPMEVDAAD